MPHAVLDGRRLAYERVGVGFPTLFLNGSGSTMDKARPLWMSFAGTADVVVHDYRGIGESERGAPPSMADFASDACRLADELGWRNFDIVGVSFGGMVALELASSVRERCRRLVLMCTSAGGDCGSSYPLHELLDLEIADRRRLLPELSDRRFTPEHLDRHPQIRSLIEQSIDDRPVGRGDREQMEARRHHDASARLSSITAETFVASGRYDGIAPPENGRRMSALIPGARFHEYEGGHMFFVQDDRALLDIRAFLEAEDEGAHR